jgi:hypothetical protein
MDGMDGDWAKAHKKAAKKVAQCDDSGWMEGGSFLLPSQANQHFCWECGNGLSLAQENFLA